MAGAGRRARIAPAASAARRRPKAASASRSTTSSTIAGALPMILYPDGIEEQNMGERYIFTIRQLTKTYNKKEILKDIWLAFYPGAKIGVIGPNGSGKSTLLRIMALEDKDFLGEATPDNGISVGYVPQEPQLTPGKTVLENV